MPMIPMTTKSSTSVKPCLESLKAKLISASPHGCFIVLQTAYSLEQHLKHKLKPKAGQFDLLDLAHLRRHDKLSACLVKGCLVNGITV